MVASSSYCNYYCVAGQSKDFQKETVLSPQGLLMLSLFEPHWLHCSTCSNCLGKLANVSAAIEALSRVGGSANLARPVAFQCRSA